MKKVLLVIGLGLGGFALTSAQTATSTSTKEAAPKACCSKGSAEAKACCSKTSAEAGHGNGQCHGKTATSDASDAKRATPAAAQDRKNAKATKSSK